MRKIYSRTERINQNSEVIVMVFQVDFMKMLEEIKAIKEKYNMPKGILLVPDKLEISVQRISYDQFHLSYKEFFNYLPNQIQDIAIPITINTLIQTGIPRERITRIANNGVAMEFDGNFLQIASALFAELLIQRRFDDDEIISFFSSVARIRKAFTDLSELEFEWNSDIEKRFYSNLENLFKLMQEHPSLLMEIEAIAKKIHTTK